MLNSDTMAAASQEKGFLYPELSYPVEIPYHILKGALPGPSLVVSAGIHGAEYASIEAVNQLTRLDLSKLKGKIILLPVVNTSAFFARSIYLNPLDQKNLNRVFPGNPAGSFAERLAFWLCETFIAKADAYIDLHGGDMIESLTPFTIFMKGDNASQRLAEVFGIEVLVGSESKGMTIAAGSSLGIPSILAEAGGQGLWPAEEVERLRVGVERVLIHLGMLEGRLEPRPHKTLSEFAWLSSAHKGFWHPSIVAGERVSKGQFLGRLSSLLGEPLEDIVSPIEGIVLFSVSSLAINQGDPLAGIGA